MCGGCRAFLPDVSNRRNRGFIEKIDPVALLGAAGFSYAPLVLIRDPFRAILLTDRNRFTSV